MGFAGRWGRVSGSEGDPGGMRDPGGSAPSPGTARSLVVPSWEQNRKRAKAPRGPGRGRKRGWRGSPLQPPGCGWHLGAAKGLAPPARTVRGRGGLPGAGDVLLGLRKKGR